VLDSYFQPSASLDLAQHLAAEAFRADYTFFLTCGTSIANQVAFDALAGTGKRILVDRTAHQSIHIAAGQSSASVDYAPAADGLSPAGQPAAAPHRVAANTYTCTRVPGHEPGTAAGAGRRPMIGTPPRPVSATHGDQMPKQTRLASNANRPGNSMPTGDHPHEDSSQ